MNSSLITVFDVIFHFSEFAIQKFPVIFLSSFELTDYTRTVSK